MRILNPLMKWMLRSPLHFFVSSSYMLITVIGRKSGKQYTTPVQYRRDGSTLTVITSAVYSWWRNLRGGAEVQLWLRGKALNGTAEIFEETDAVVAAFQHVYPKATPQQVAQMTPGRVAVKIALQ
jgi:deazaflavin-dependent oxidoreductase (nitroreductase family)